MLEGAEFQSRMKVYSDSECDVYKKEVPGLGRNGKTITIYYFVQTELYEAEGGNFLAMGEPNIVLYLDALEKLGLENGEICEVDTFLQVYEDKGGSAFLDFDFSLIRKTEPEYDELTKEDVALFQKYLLGEDVALGNKNYDVNGDGVWDSYDLIKMRRMFTGESPWNADIDNSDADVVSHETSSDHSWLWGQDYYDEGSIEAAVNNEKKTFVGKWENTGSAYFYNNDLLTYGYPMKADDEYPMTLRYEYTADGEGDFIVGSIVKTFEKRKVSFFCDYIYIAESYSGLEDITSGECLGTLTSQTGTKYDVYARRADMGLEVFVLRRDKLPLGKLNKGTIRTDYLLEQLPELVPDLKHEVINTYFGVKCVGESSGYISCRPARGRDGYYWGYYE